MKILVMNPSIGDAYGQEKVIRDSSRLLREAGHKVYFLMEQSRGNLPENEGFKIEPLMTKGHPIRSPLALRRMTQHILKHIDTINPDIVHMTDLFPAHMMEEIALRFPSVHTAHLNSTTCPASVRIANHSGLCTKKSGWTCLFHDKFQDCMHSFRGNLRKLDAIHSYKTRKNSLKYFSKIIGISQYIVDTLALDGWSKEKLELVYNPVMVPPPRQETREENSIIIVSRLEVYKGVSLALKALSILKNQDWSLKVCGEGPRKESLIKEAKTLGIESKVTFLGKTSFEKTQNLISQSRIFIQANLGPEPFGLALAEASSLGTPAIITNVPALNEIVEDQVNGLVVKANSEMDLAEAISSLLHDQQLWEKLSLAGPPLMAKKFSPEKHLNETLRIYRKMAGEGLEPPTKGL